MAQFIWAADFEDGVLKNHALSAKIREAAIAQTKIVPFVDTEPGYGAHKGDSITITRIRNIAEPTSAKMSELDRLPIDTLSQSSVTIQVSEYGRGVEYTHKAQLLAHYDVEDKIQRKLRQQLSLVLDTAAATAFKTAKVVVTPSSLTALSTATDGTCSTTATVNMTVNHVKLIRDMMADTYHIPGWNGGDRYICLISVKAARGIKNDPEFQAWRQQLDPSGAWYKGMIGTIENIDFIEVNHSGALSGSLGTGGTTTGQALFFGEDAVAMAVAEDPELRAAIPGQFGRERAVAWYGVLEFGLIWDTANDGEARVIRFDSL